MIRSTWDISSTETQLTRTTPQVSACIVFYIVPSSPHNNYSGPPSSCHHASFAGVLHSAIIFWTAFLVVPFLYPNGRTFDMFGTGIVIYTGCVLVSNLQIGVKVCQERSRRGERRGRGMDRHRALMAPILVPILPLCFCPPP